MTNQPLLQVPARQDIINLFPDFTPTDLGMGLVPHDLGSTIMLRNLGLEVPSPVSTYYEFPHPPGKPPFEVQIDTVEMLTENKRAYVLSGMGVGKTVCSLWAFDYLKSIGQASKMLIVAPLSTLRFTWAKEIFEFINHRKVAIVYGKRAKRLEQLARQDVDIYVVNHDGVKVIYDALTKRPDINVLVLDELAVYRNNTDRTKLMIKFAATKEWVWGLTGAPTPRSPTDVYQQAKIITPHLVPKYYGPFRDQLMIKVSNFKYVPRVNANEMAFKVLQPSVRYTLEDVTELPPYISRRIDVDMGPRQTKIYEEMRKHCFGMVGASTITAANAAAALNKLLQISLGYVYDQQGRVVQLDNGPRVDALMDILASRTGKVIVFSAFKHCLASLEAAMKAARYDVATVSGDTPAGKRGEIFHAFQNTLQYEIINAHPQCMAHGLTLTAADTIVWFGPITSLEIYQQANARIRRVGQKGKQQYLHLQSTKAEKRIYELLIKAGNVQEELLDMFRE
jgi:SNF2 family DNA or RNA helicase